MTPTKPRILPDRDKHFNYYLDEDIIISMPDNSSIFVSKGYRFDGHTVPLLFRLLLPKYNSTDVYAALIHDVLVDFESMHRYNRAYIDSIYTFYMRGQYRSTAFRAFIMPLAVQIYGYLRFTLWGDYRGEPKPNTTVEIKIT